MQTHWRPRTKWVFPGGEWIKCPNKYSWVLHLRPRQNGKTWPRLGSPNKSTTNTTPNYPQTNMMPKPNSQRFNMTYTKREAPILVPIEHKLCSELGLDRSELHKVAIKEFWHRLSNPPCPWFEVDMAKSVKVSDAHCQMLVDVGKRWRMKPDDLVEELIQ